MKLKHLLFLGLGVGAAPASHGQNLTAVKDSMVSYYQNHNGVSRAEASKKVEADYQGFLNYYKTAPAQAPQAYMDRSRETLRASGANQPVASPVDSPVASPVVKAPRVLGEDEFKLEVAKQRLAIDWVLNGKQQGPNIVLMTAEEAKKTVDNEYNQIVSKYKDKKAGDAAYLKAMQKPLSAMISNVENKRLSTEVAWRRLHNEKVNEFEDRIIVQVKAERAVLEHGLVAMLEQKIGRGDAMKIANDLRQSYLTSNPKNGDWYFANTEPETLNRVYGLEHPSKASTAHKSGGNAHKNATRSSHHGKSSPLNMNNINAADHGFPRP